MLVVAVHLQRDAFSVFKVARIMAHAGSSPSSSIARAPSLARMHSTKYYTVSNLESLLEQAEGVLEEKEKELGRSIPGLSTLERLLLEAHQAVMALEDPLRVLRTDGSVGLKARAHVFI